MWHAIILGYNWKQDSKASKLCWTYHTYCSLPHLFWIKILLLSWNLSSELLTQQLVPIWKNIHFWQNSCTISSGLGEWREPTNVLPQAPFLSGCWGGLREPWEQETSLLTEHPIMWPGWELTKHPAPPASPLEAAHLPPHFPRYQLPLYSNLMGASPTAKGLNLQLWP